MVLPPNARIAVGLLVAAGIAYLATPIAIATAQRFAFYDKPVGYKGHARPTPYLGGAVVMLAFALAASLGAGHPRRTLPLLGGVAVLLALGTIDDRRNVSAGLRAGTEFLLGTLLAAAGLGWHLGAGLAVDALVTGVWVMGVVNAFNLFDNMDGQASTMAAVVSAGACALAISTGATWAAVGSAALCGACLGFLPHNLALPAKIFLGDGGSMPLGFAVAALVASAARSAEPSTLALLVGFLMVGVPALDTTLVIVSRRRRGISILTGGQDHLTHRARRRVGTAARVALVLGGAQALVSALVIVAAHGGNATIVYVLLAFLVGAAATIGTLESLETPAVVPPTGRGSAAPATPSSASGGRLPPDSLSLALLALLGLGAGVSPMFEAYYGTGVWTPIGLVAVIAAAVAMVARPPRLTRPAVLAVTGLAGLGLWSLLSSSWSPTPEQATLDANRWLVYAATLLLALSLVRGRRHAAVLIGAAGLGVLVVAGDVVVGMLGSGAYTLILGGRLNLPLGYINGEGCVFAMACWPALALAERRRPLPAGLGAATVVILASLTLLTQSRGGAIAVAVTALALLLWVPGRRRRILALAVTAAGVAAAAPALLKVYSSSGVASAPPNSVVHRAALAMVAAAVVAGLAWAGAVALERRVRAGARGAQSERLASAAAVALIVIPLLAGAVKFGSIERTVRTQWQAFVHLSDSVVAGSSTAAESRLLSGGGNRYDYWRVAWHLFTANPVAGAGGGGYTVSYYRQRRTTEAIENPHSIEIETLAELGLVGFALLAAFIAGAALAARRRAATARSSAAARGLLVAAGGAALTWLIDSSGDWMHLLPGVSAIALLAVAALTSRDPADAEQTPDERAAMPGRPTRDGRGIIAAAAAGFVLAVAGAGLLRTGMAQIYLDAATSDLAHNPAAALTNANRALRLDGSNLNSYYVKAAALARFDRAAAARAVLLQAARSQPQSFVTWTLLGDLEVRTGDVAGARAYYVRAHRLDPNDPSLAALVANPASALSSAG